MNQTKQRLKIIKLAITITDMETIQLQIFKLSPLKMDLEIQEIIAGLQAENYAQTQALITKYIETPTKKILQRTVQEAKQRKEVEEQNIIDEFDLFVTADKKVKDVEKDLFDFTMLEPKSEEKIEQESIDFDALLNIEANDILSGNIELDIPQTPQDTFFEGSTSIKEIYIDTETIPKDTFFDIQENSETKDKAKEEIPENPIEDETSISSEENLQKVLEDDTQEEPEITTTKEKEISHYEAIPYISQKFKNMQTQYPATAENDEEFTSVKAWLSQISNDGYKNDEVEEIIKHITKLIEADNLAEAAQLLLISGATKSKFAQFMLARALYKGDILQKNLPEAFTLINRLAMDDDYPEAICDLAQFYEHGIGIGKDKKRAEMLYKSAMDLDIKRAIGHYDRLRKHNNSFFSAFKK